METNFSQIEALILATCHNKHDSNNSSVDAVNITMDNIDFSAGKFNSPSDALAIRLCMGEVSHDKNIEEVWKRIREINANFSNEIRLIEQDNYLFLRSDLKLDEINKENLSKSVSGIIERSKDTVIKRFSNLNTSDGY